MMNSKLFLLAGLLVSSCSAESFLRRVLKKNEFCTPVPLFVNPFSGQPIYDGDIFFMAITNGKPMDTFALEAVMPLSYNNITDCGFLLGATREILECTSILEAQSNDPNAILIKCAYLTNTIDPFPAVTYEEQPEAVAKCACTCKGDREVEGLFLDGECNCYCDPKNVDCECAVPSVTQYITSINAAYSRSNITSLTAGVNGALTRIYEVPLLDHEDCGSPNATSYNLTGVCPGALTEAFSSQFTEPPTDAPTDR